MVPVYGFPFVASRYDVLFMVPHLCFSLWRPRNHSEKTITVTITRIHNEETTNEKRNEKTITEGRFWFPSYGFSFIISRLWFPFLISIYGCRLCVPVCGVSLWCPVYGVLFYAFRYGCRETITRKP